MTASNSDKQALTEILERFSLETRQRPVDLVGLAKEWGVVSIEKEPISSEAMLIQSGDGYKIVLKDVQEQTYGRRQRFSFAHELGHLLLQRCGLEQGSNSMTKHRESFRQSREERLCDQLAAEILMPRDAFREDGVKNGWSLNGLRNLSREYETSIPATARRMIDLAPETSLFAIWGLNENHIDSLSLRQSYSRTYRYAIPNAKTLLNRRMWLVFRAMKALDVQSGIAPVIDKFNETAAPPDAPAEALAWGSGEYKQVMVYYYPERELTDEMIALGNATWRT